MSQDGPHGFILSESALYAFQCQEVYPDIISFAAAIPNHLKPLFLIPIKLESVVASIAMRVASKRFAQPSGDTPEGDLFGTKTFVTDDNDSSPPGTDEGSIFEINDPEHMTHHQENNYDQDENIDGPADAGFYSDLDVPDGHSRNKTYPYNTPEKPRHSSHIPHVAIVRVALKPEALQVHAPTKIQDNAKTCAVTLISYDKNTRVFTFNVKASSTPRVVQAALSEIDHIALSCNCPFWRYNGPEFHAKENAFMLGQPFGTATPPDVRDPDRQYWLCKHAYAVLRRLENFVQEVTEENWELDDDELLSVVDAEWDRMEGTALIPAQELEKDDVDLEVNWGENTPEDDALEEQVDEPEVDEPEVDEPEVDEPEVEGQEPEVQAQEPSPESQEPEVPFEDEYDVQDQGQAPIDDRVQETQEPEVPFEDEFDVEPEPEPEPEPDDESVEEESAEESADAEEEPDPAEEESAEEDEEVQDYSGEDEEVKPKK